MDVVRSNIERIGGDVDVFSRLGEGTTLKIKIPLTLAIVPALIVSTGGQRFAVPQVSLIELVRVAGENIQTQIEEIRGALFYRLRGNLLPLVYLHQELRMSPATAVEEDQGIDTQVVNIVVVRADEHIFGLVVDNVHDTEEIVVKPLGKQLKEIEVFAGATIMGDGRVALIVDVPGLAKQSRIRQERVREKGQERLAGSDSADAESTRQALLIVGLGEDYRTAIPLSLVNRLEEFPNKDIERASGREVIQYRGGILPLVDLRRHFGGTHEGQDEMKRVVVYAENGRSVGLVVEQIMDIVEENVVLQHREGRPGILGTSIIQKKVTDLLDVPAILRQADSSFYNQTPVNGGI